MCPIKLPQNKLLILIIAAFLLVGVSSTGLARSFKQQGKAESGAISAPAGLEVPIAGPVSCDESLGMAGPFPCHNVDLLGYIPANVFGGFTAADIWGWTDPATGREYAIVSHSMATSFVDVSDPVNPVLIGELPAPVPNVLWRDVDVYKNHAFIVADGDFVLPHGIQIFDLTQLRGLSGPPVVFATTARYLGVGNTHTFTINAETGVGYAVGSNTCSAGLHMVDLNEPASPAFLGCFGDDGYTHETQCVIYHGPDAAYQGHEICFAANEDTLTLVDVTDKSAPVMLARQGYAGYGYTHQGWLTEDHAYFIQNDELDEQNDLHNTYFYLWNMSDLDAPLLFNTYVGPTTAIDHNLYVVGQYVFESNYTAGLRIMDNSDIANGNLVEVGYFDTHPASDAPVYGGTWGNYPFFASGTIVVSNIQDGLYILKPNLPGFPEPPAADVEATGGGWLATAGQKKINFGFDVQFIDGELAGDFQLNDKATGSAIQISQLTGLADGSAVCASLVSGESVAEIAGDGTFNGAAASFRVCISDNGEPGKGNDGLYLECTAGCSYNTGSSALDNVIDGGNIQVAISPPEPEGEAQATTMILDPVLLSKGPIGQLQLFTVRVYDQNQQPMSGAAVTIKRIAANGNATTLTGITNAAGMVVFTFTNLSQSAEYRAFSGIAESNAVQLAPVLP